MKPLNSAFSFSRFLLVILTVVTPALCQDTDKDKDQPDKVVVERVADTAFVQLRAPSFQALTPRQQALAYWLTQASIAIDPIIYDQLSASGCARNGCWKKSWPTPSGDDPVARMKISEFARLFWANRGNHNELTSQKFLPGFTFEELQSRRHRPRSITARFQTPYADLPPLKNSQRSAAGARRAARFVIRSPLSSPWSIAKSPAGGKDTIQASSNTFYPGLSLDDLKGFHGKISARTRAWSRAPTASSPNWSIAPERPTAKSLPASTPPS